jgi:hypothetical protein
MTVSNQEKPAADFLISYHGSIALLRPVSDNAKQWIEDFVATEDWMWHGDALAIEPRYLGDLLEVITDSGFSFGIA